MKLLVLLALALVPQQPIRPLDRVIALALRDVTVADALRTIADSAHVAIDFNRTDVARDARRVTLVAPSVTVRSALDYVLNAHGFVAREAGANELFITRSDSLVTINGIVTDSIGGHALGGVNVVVKGTKIGTVTRADGVYLVRAPSGRVTLQFYRIGYQAKEVMIPAGTTTLDVTLAASPATLTAVQITAENRRLRPVEHTSDLAVVEEIKASPSIVSGIASEQIAKSADINAAQIVRHIAGVTVTDESFLVVRGMNQRYNATYLDDNLAPSTELYSRAFDLSLIPDRIVDKILVYKSPRADLIGDMTGAAVKIYTKDALAISRFDVSVRVADRPISTGKSTLGYSGGATDWLGIDDGARALPKDVPGFGSFQRAQLSQNQYIASFSPVLTDHTIRSAPADGQLTANYYDNWKLGGGSLFNVTTASYTTESRFDRIYQQRGQSQDPSITPGSNNGINTVEHDQRGSQKANLNLMENLTFRINPAHELYFKNFVLQQGTAVTVDQIQYPNDSVTNKFGNFGSGVRGMWHRNIILDWEQRFLYQGNLGGTHELTGSQSVAWNLGFTSTLHTIPDQRTTRFQNSNFYQPGSPNYNAAEPFDLSWTAIDRAGSMIGVYDQTGTISRVWTRNAERLYNASFDYTLSPASWASFKVGTYDFLKDRDVARREYLVYDGELASSASGVNAGDGTYTPPGSSHYVNDNLIHFRPQDLSGVWSTHYFPNDMTGLGVVDGTLPTDAYKATEGSGAGYVMTTLTPFGDQVEINGGVRVEYDQIKLAAAAYANGILSNGNGSSSPELADPIFVDRHTTSWLPSVNLSWRPARAFVARASYGKTVNRPEFREISPFADYNYEDNTVVNGNPGLVQANIDNYDARLELYPGPRGEMISVGAFYKGLRHPIERLETAITQQFSGVGFLDQISYDNAPHAVVRGLEAELRKALFWNLSVIGSGALIDSRVSGYPKVTGAAGAFFSNRPLQGQTPYVLDAGLFYDNPLSGTKVGATYTESGTSIYAVGVTNTNYAQTQGEYRGSILELPRGLLEMAITQSIGQAWRFKLSGQNLLNEAIRFAEDQNRNSKYDREHLARVNVNQASGGTPTYETVYVGDNIYRRYNPGQYFLFTITRSF